MEYVFSNFSGKQLALTITNEKWLIKTTKKRKVKHLDDFIMPELIHAFHN